MSLDYHQLSFIKMEKIHLKGEQIFSLKSNHLCYHGRTPASQFRSPLKVYSFHWAHAYCAKLALRQSQLAHNSGPPTARQQWRIAGGPIVARRCMLFGMQLKVHTMQRQL